jgi:hypothetical protein
MSDLEKIEKRLRVLMHAETQRNNKSTLGKEGSRFWLVSINPSFDGWILRCEEMMWDHTVMGSSSSESFNSLLDIMAELQRRNPAH